MSQYPDDLIDLLIQKAAMKLSYKGGKECRKLMFENGMTEQEIDEVVKKAFAWLHKPEIKN